MKNSKILRVLLITALLLVCGSSGVPAEAEMVTKNALDDFDRTLKRDYQASFAVSKTCYNYSITDREGNNLLTSIREKGAFSTTYTFDDDKLLFFHLPYVKNTKYHDFIYLYDTDYYVIEPKENGAFLIEYPNDHTSYVINAVDGMKIICDGDTVTLSAPSQTTVKVELHTYTDNGDYNMYFDIPINEIGSTFSYVNKIFQYEGTPIKVLASAPDDNWGYLNIEASDVIDLAHDFLILYRTSKAAEKPAGVSQASNVTFFWNKIPKAKRYVICKKTEDGFVKIGKVKETNYLTTISQNTLFKVKAQRKVKGKWKTIKTSTVVAKME